MHAPARKGTHASVGSGAVVGAWGGTRTVGERCMHTGRQAERVEEGVEVAQQRRVVARLQLQAVVALLDGGDVLAHGAQLRVEDVQADLEVLQLIRHVVHAL